jgi:hypothetical protein
MNLKTVTKETKSILNVLNQKFQESIDGKNAINEMKNKGFSNWKQMEWPGWYFEDVGRDVLIDMIGGSKGPTYGRTQFDYMNEHVWDMKFHAINDKHGNYNPWLILNDTYSIEQAITDFGGLGFMILSAIVTYDKTGEFKQWHDMMKGGKSSYEWKRIKRGAPSRIRKTSFTIQSWTFLFFDDFLDLKNGKSAGWAGGFQKGMRNADGSTRKEKIKINIDQLPNRYIILKI